MLNIEEVEKGSFISIKIDRLETRLYGYRVYKTYLFKVDNHRELICIAMAHTFSNIQDTDHHTWYLY